jgi:hypothetical protein
MKSRSENHCESAFTRTDLVCTLAILLLVAFVVPLRANLRPQSDRAICLNNVRQLAMSTVMFAGDNKDLLPRPGAGLSLQSWAYDANVPTASGVMDYSAQIAKAPKGMLWPYHGQLLTMRCPGDRTNTATEVTRFRDRPLKLTSYGMNGFVVDNTSAQNQFKMSQFRPEAIFFWEKDETSGFAFADASNFPSAINGASTRHVDVPLSCADGSAEWMPMRSFTTLRMSSTAGRVYCYPLSTTGRY